MNRYSFLLPTVLAYFICLFSSCSQIQNSTPDFTKYISEQFPYNLGTPVEKFLLPDILEEISGLEYYRDGILACIQDEKGSVFTYNTLKKKIDREIKFGKSGDYEGIALNGDTAYVIRSNGRLFKVFGWHDNKPIVTEIPTAFSEINNIEGLCFLPAEKKLLIACKNKGGLYGQELSGRVIYHMDPVNQSGEPGIFYRLTNEVYLSGLDSFSIPPVNHSPFKPSGLSVHPLTGDIYIISSVGKILLVLNKEKQLIAMVPLPRSLFRQPEGICFSPDGDLYLSSEGDEGSGYILKFEPIKNNR